jgi:psiF repeat
LSLTAASHYKAPGRLPPERGAPGERLADIQLGKILTMKIIALVTSAAMTACLLGGAAFAQTAAPAPAADAATPKAAPAKAAPVQHSAQSLECSKQADAKGLHGSERKKFRATCIKSAAK